MIDHTTVGVSDYAKSREFYRQVLAPLGYELLTEFGAEAAGYGDGGYSDFWIDATGANDPPLHVAFRATSEDAVEQFYRTALDAGGRDNGGPGLRDYDPGYYAAFILDPDGHNIEVVYHQGWKKGAH